MSEHGAPPQEPFHVHAGLVFLAIVVFLSVSCVGIYWSYRMQRATEQDINPSGPAGTPRELGASMQGMVNQWGFKNTGIVLAGPPTHLREVRNSADQTIPPAEDPRLDGYAWTDRAAGKIHIPIERAMELEAGAATGDAR